MRMKPLGIFAIAASLALTACGGEPEGTRESGDANEAEGEVLGGEISDDMIALDQLKSQSPPLKEAPDSGGGGAAPSDTDADPAEPAAEPAAPAEAAEPAPANDAEGDEG